MEGLMGSSSEETCLQLRTDDTPSLYHGSGPKGQGGSEGGNAAKAANAITSF